MNRGLLIVLEGIDQSGKTTVSKLLNSKLNSLNFKTIIQSFPDKTTLIGNILNSYLKNNTNLTPQESHLLFSLNRHQIKNYMKEKLESGVNIICDRYVYSGIAYSLANNLDLNFCINTEKYLIKPDLVFYFNIDISEASKRRKSLQLDIYETTQFQTKVKEAYNKIKTKDWIIINANNNPNEILNIIFNQILLIKNIPKTLEYY